MCFMPLVQTIKHINPDLMASMTYRRGNRAVKQWGARRRFYRWHHVVLQQGTGWRLAPAGRGVTLNIHTLIAFSASCIVMMDSPVFALLETPFHTYLMGSSKQFLHFVFFDNVRHQTRSLRNPHAPHHPASSPTHPICSPANVLGFAFAQCITCLTSEVQFNQKYNNNGFIITCSYNCIYAYIAYIKLWFPKTR